MDKSRVKGILLNYLNDYYAEYPEELDSGEIANWGELDSYYEDYPEIFQKLVNGDPDDPEVEELWNFAEKVWDAWTTFAKSLNALDESTTNKKIENRLAEAFEKTIKNLQKEGLFENVSSFDLNFNGKGINIKLNESRPGNRNVSFKKRSNLKENESDKVTYVQDFDIDAYGDTSDAEEAAAELGIDLSFSEGMGNLGMDEIWASASSEEVLKEFLYDWGFIESYSDFEDGLDD